VVKDVVDVDSINSFVVKFEVKEFARFLEITLINNTWWSKLELALAFSCRSYKILKGTEQSFVRM
jgi:hypothetical protein